jgi:hypothetical protein
LRLPCKYFHIIHFLSNNTQQFVAVQHYFCYFPPLPDIPANSGGEQMKKMFARAVLCVFALSLVSLAADRTLVTTKPVKGGHAAKVERPNPAVITLLSTMASLDPKGLYYCCSGNIIAGPNNPDGFSPFSEAIQFTLASASHVKSIATSVNYITPAVDTQFEFNIEADASGVPSGVPLNAAPYKVTINSQTFGACCAVETKPIGGAAGKSLAAGTYWIVWSSISSTSDLAAEVNVAILDQVDLTNVAYSASNGVAGSWNAYTTTLPFVVKVKGTTP